MSADGRDLGRKLRSDSKYLAGRPVLAKLLNKNRKRWRTWENEQVVESHEDILGCVYNNPDPITNPKPEPLK